VIAAFVVTVLIS